MKYAAFLRGINVGGKNKVKMEDLRRIFTDAGFENVKTYINSGNIIFETGETDDKKLAEKIEQAIEKDLGLNIKTMVRSVAEIAETVEHNPFDGQFKDDKDLHVFFLDEALPAEKSELLLVNNHDGEKFAVRNREIYYLKLIPFSDSLMGQDYLAKKLKVSATARNWRTVNKMLEF